MSVLDLKLPDFSGHPPPPKLSFEEYEAWIINECIPAAAARGEMTPEKLVADFMNNEGRVTEWPDFGAVTDKYL
jgi:hypothetical protein